MSEKNDSSSEPMPSPTIGLTVVANGSDQTSPDAKALKSLFRIALETRNFEIAQLVQRNNFFMIFQGVLLGGVVQSAHTKPVVSFLVCLAGFGVSVYQVKMASGAKFWQEYWEAALHRIEKELVAHLISDTPSRGKIFHLFHEDDAVYREMVKERMKPCGFGFSTWLVLQRYSVSRVPIYVASVLSSIWLLLLLCTMRGYAPFSVPSFVVGF